MQLKHSPGCTLLAGRKRGVRRPPRARPEGEPKGGKPRPNPPRRPRAARGRAATTGGMTPMRNSSTSNRARGRPRTRRAQGQEQLLPRSSSWRLRSWRKRSEQLHSWKIALMRWLIYYVTTINKRIIKPRISLGVFRVGWKHVPCSDSKVSRRPHGTAPLHSVCQPARPKQGSLGTAGQVRVIK